MRRKRLPPPCEECRPYEGWWRWNPLADGLERCGCRRGRALARAQWIRGAAQAGVLRRKKGDNGFSGGKVSSKNR
jgi:hypothetical protein